MGFGMFFFKDFFCWKFGDFTTPYSESTWLATPIGLSWPLTVRHPLGVASHLLSRWWDFGGMWGQGRWRTRLQNAGFCWVFLEIVVGKFWRLFLEIVLGGGFKAATHQHSAFDMSVVSNTSVFTPPILTNIFQMVFRYLPRSFTASLPLQNGGKGRRWNFLFERYHFSIKLLNSRVAEFRCPLFWWRKHL